MKDKNQGPAKVKQQLYGKHVLISTCIFAPILIAALIFLIFYAIFDTDSSLGGRIFAVLMLTIGTSGMIWLLGMNIKHRVITARVTLDLKGVYYQGKSRFFLSWEQIHRIEVNHFQFHYKQIPKPYIVFYTNYTNQKKLPLTADQVSDEFIFTHYTWKLHSFIENQVKRTVVENCKTPKRFRNREYRKRHCELNKLWKRP